MPGTLRLPVTGRHGTHAWIEVDRDDFVRLPKGIRLNARGQVFGKLGGREIPLARILLGVTEDRSVEVDHINRDPLDNRRSNLRVLPRGTNSQNMSPHSDSVSQYRGVAWDKRRGKWKATTTIAGRLKHVGYFDDEAEAGAAARAYRLEHMQYAID